MKKLITKLKTLWKIIKMPHLFSKSFIYSINHYILFVDASYRHHRFPLKFILPLREVPFPTTEWIITAPEDSCALEATFVIFAIVC